MKVPIDFQEMTRDDILYLIKICLVKYNSISKIKYKIVKNDI